MRTTIRSLNLPSVTKKSERTSFPKKKKEKNLYTRKSCRREDGRVHTQDK